MALWDVQTGVTAAQVESRTDEFQKRRPVRLDEMDGSEGRGTDQRVWGLLRGSCTKWESLELRRRSTWFSRTPPAAELRGSREPCGSGIGICSAHSFCGKRNIVDDLCPFTLCNSPSPYVYVHDTFVYAYYHTGLHAPPSPGRVARGFSRLTFALADACLSHRLQHLGPVSCNTQLTVYTCPGQCVLAPKIAALSWTFSSLFNYKKSLTNT